jgi:hypothetical protein
VLQLRGLVDNVAARVTDDNWAKIAIGVCSSASQWHQGKCVGALGAQQEALKAAMAVTKEADTNWTVPVLQAVAADAFAIAASCHKGAGEFASETITERRKPLELLAQSLRVAFGVTVTHRIRTGDKHLSKKHGTLGISLLLLRVYTLLGQSRACVNTATNAEKGGSLPLHLFPMSQQVPYHYFRGRVAIVQGELEKARMSLKFALANTPDLPKFAANRRRIMSLLVPVMLHFGQVPSAKLLAKHKLQHYSDIVAAFASGHISRFGAAIDAQRTRLLRDGVYYTLEQLGQVVLRNLMKRAFDGLGSTNVVPLAVARAALASVGAPSSEDAAECALAGLIHRGLLLGYIAHSAQKLVRAKQNPFPLSAINGRL